MRKPLVITLVYLMSIMTLGCATNQNDIVENETITINDKIVSEESTDKEWTEDEIINLFEQNYENSDYEILGCVVVSDYASDMVGAILFSNSENLSNVAFIDAEGYYQRCGSEAIPCVENEFTYLGNGIVTVKMQTEDLNEYNYKLSFMQGGNVVKWIAEDDLPEGSGAE